MTSTDIAHREQTGPLALVPTSPEQVTAALEQWVGGLAASVRGAEYMVDTPMCPDSFWPLPPDSKSKTPKQVLPGETIEAYRERRQVATYTLGSVVRYGLQLGLPPEVAVQGIFTIGGRMSMYAEQMVALIKSRGHGHRVVERGPQRCVVEVRRAGVADWTRFEFTIDDAITAGYVPNAGPNANPGKWPDGNPKKSGGNAKYLTDPAAMLYARTSSIACRTEMPDVLRGLVAYEDVQDERAAQPVDITASVEMSEPSRPTAAAILAAGQQSASENGHAEPEVRRAVLPLAEAQWRRINARFVELEVVGEGQTAQRLKVIAHIVGHPIARGGELTAIEGQLVLDNLAGDAGYEVLGQALDPLTQPATDVAGQDAADELLGDNDDDDGDGDPNSQWDDIDGAEAEAEAQ